MPQLIAVIGAIGGATALAGGGLTVFQTIAAIGGVVSGIGAVTGNDTLMRLGAVAGLAGGAGAFAQSKGWLASGSAAGTAGAEAASSNIDALTKTAAPGVTPVVPDVVQSSAMGNTAGLETGSIGQNVTSANPLAGNGLYDTVGSVTDAGIVGSPLTAGPGAASAPLPMDPGGFIKSLGETQLGAGARDMRFDAGAGSKEMSILDRLQGFGKFVKENKELSSIAANFVGGMFDDEKEAKADYYKSAAEATRAKTERGSAVPDMKAKLKQSGPIWKTSSPTYNAPRPSGLFYAR